MAEKRLHRQNSQAAAQGHLLARPVQPTLEARSTGMQRLDLDGPRDGLLYVPATYQVDHPAPLVLMLHGAGGIGRSGITPFLPFADANRVLLLAPDSREVTWDVLMGGYGPDVEFIEQALEHTFHRYTVDATHLAIEGFSDGASYALSLGLTNGDLFTHVLAFSPGFMAPANLQGKPRIYVSHGIHDRVLPASRCSRRIVPQLQRMAYDVHYNEFDGPHSVPEGIARDGLRWFMEGGD